jgi:hypothetical protein
MRSELPISHEAKISLITDYVRISLERIQEVEDTGINRQTRLAQDNRTFYECPTNSLTKEGLAKVRIKEAEYMRSNPLLPSRLLFLKILIRESYLNCNATTSMIRTKLTNLDTYIGQVGNDIGKFDKYVQNLLEALNARGETTTDLLTNLFKGYAACSDKAFVRYIAEKQDDYEEGKNIDATELMILAGNKFKILKTKRSRMHHPMKKQNSSQRKGKRIVDVAVYYSGLCNLIFCIL